MNHEFDVVIVGGSYAGLAAGMALGRALRKVLIVDSGKPCNVQTPFSHNFLTRDGQTPTEISTLARRQVEAYDTVRFLDGLMISVARTQRGFELHTHSGERFEARKVIFATGIRDLLPDIEGLAECWGISVLHCPYCHGYEVRGQKTGVLANGDAGFEFASLLRDWTDDLTMFTNGPSILSREQSRRLAARGIAIIEQPVTKLEHTKGHLQGIVFEDGSRSSLSALYTRPPFEQSCSIPETLGCELTAQGYIKVDGIQKTTVDGVFACGDNASSLRTLANAVATGTTTGMMSNKELVLDELPD